MVGTETSTYQPVNLTVILLDNSSHPHLYFPLDRSQ